VNNDFPSAGLHKYARRQAPPRWFLALALMLALPACDSARKPAGGKSGAGQPALPPRKVQTARVAERRIERTVIALGSLVAFEQATLSAKVAGRVQEIRVDIGSRVRRGDPLAIMEPIDYQLKVQQAAAALTQARAALGLPLDGESDQIKAEDVTAVKEARAVLDEAKANHERIKSLSKDKVISDSQLDTAQSAYLVALNRYQDALDTVRQKQALVVQRRAEFAIASQQLTDTTLAAPFDGGVQARLTSVGAYLVVGAPIVTLVRLDPLRLRVEVSERDAIQVRPGQVARFSVEGDTNVFSGRIQRLSPALNDTRMLVVEADIPLDDRLHPGYFTRAEIVTLPEALALTIPTNAVVTFSGLEKAFAIRNGKAVEKRITTRKRGPDWIEVPTGLAAGEEIILNPGNLQNGNPVIPVSAAEMEASKPKGTKAEIRNSKSETRNKF
jgi:RND family efflux transporter MFP subunit